MLHYNKRWWASYRDHSIVKSVLLFQRTGVAHSSNIGKLTTRYNSGSREICSHLLASSGSIPICVHVHAAHVCVQELEKQERKHLGQQNTDPLSTLLCTKQPTESP